MCVCVCVYTCVYVCTYISPFQFLNYVCVLQFQAHKGKEVSIVLCSAEPRTMQIKARCNEKLLKNKLKKIIVKRVEAFIALATKIQRNLNWRPSLKVRSCGKEGCIAGLDSRALQLSSACIKCPGYGTPWRGEKLYNRMLRIVVGGHAGMALWRESWALWLCISMGTVTIANSPVISPTWCQFPETKERGLDFHFLGYFFFPAVVLWVVSQNVLLATFCWYSLSVRFFIHAYEPRRLKHVCWRGQLVFIFFCSNPFPFPICSDDRTAGKPPILCSTVDFKIPVQYKGQKGSISVDIGMWIPGET